MIFESNWWEEADGMFYMKDSEFPNIVVNYAEGLMPLISRVR
jgi:hypothetical protein